VLQLGPGAWSCCRTSRITSRGSRPPASTQLFALLEQYADEVLRDAIDVALANRALSVAGVRRGEFSVTARKMHSTSSC
jgi:hypothetical protein